MKIGVIGLGIVGTACKFGFEKLGHKVVGHDIKLDTHIRDVMDTEICYICVPTPEGKKGACDTSIVESVINDLLDDRRRYHGVIAIKSTVPPGTTAGLIEHRHDNICFVPEFLRERCAISDFVENNKLLAVGTISDESYSKVVESHGHYPKHTVRLTPTQAEFLKYYHNCFNALRIIFANEMYDICHAFEEEYTPIKNALLHTASIPDIYLDVNENLRGFGGVCLPKDLAALIALCRDSGLDHSILQAIQNKNKEYKTTVFPNMRL